MTAANRSDTHRDATVRVAVRADLEYLHVFRGVAELMSASAGFDYDATDDLRLAVDEIAATLIEISASNSDVLCEFRENGSGLHVTMTADYAVAPLPNPNNFRWHIVKTLTDELSWDEDLDPARHDGTDGVRPKTVVRIMKRKASSPRGRS
ncbi:ATP-binding protein [Hoyosella subflava]|uniref:ATP-binding protein n=1 Tax=Hoyosella subflava TaxID=639313 RepID=UPI0011D1AC76|nr:ATP-binding protein [Hoyosella subflava]